MAINYLSNKKLLAGIHESKRTFCHFIEPRFHEYHAIVGDRMLISEEFVENILEERRSRKGKKAVPDMAPEDVCVRVMTFEHIPTDNTRKRKNANIEQPFARTNFPPFKHFIRKNGKLVEVGRSHWQGDLKTGQFSTTHGHVTRDLATMYMLLVDKIAKKANFCGYSFRDEMESHALLQLTMNGLQFDEFKQERPNPFAFLTSVVINAFRRVLNLERHHRDVRDMLICEAGATPSLAKQIEWESQNR